MTTPVAFSTRVKCGRERTLTKAARRGASTGRARLSAEVTAPARISSRQMSRNSATRSFCMARGTPPAQGSAASAASSLSTAGRLRKRSDTRAS